MLAEFQEFAQALQNQFFSAIKGDPSKSKQPWTDYDLDFLRSRLMDEMIEYLSVVGLLGKFHLLVTKKISEGYSHVGIENLELVDMSDFCLFIRRKNLLAEGPVEGRRMTE